MDKKCILLATSYKVEIILLFAEQMRRDNLQMSSSAKKKFTKDADLLSDAMTRPVELFASHVSIDKAEQLIKSVISEVC